MWMHPPTKKLNRRKPMSDTKKRSKAADGGLHLTPCSSSFVRMFKPQFAGLVERGEKLQTVRPVPKRMPKTGDRISLRAWTGKPYRSKQRVLRESVITKVEKIKFTRLHRVQFEDGILTCDDEWKFAVADGFETPAAMFDWFAATHGLPFEGVLISWTNVRCGGTAAQDSQSEANEGAYPPLPPTTCSANSSFVSLGVKEAMNAAKESNPANGIQ